MSFTSSTLITPWKFRKKTIQEKDYSAYNALVHKKLESQNIIEVFLKYAENQQICNANYPSISNYAICQEHMINIL